MRDSFFLFSAAAVAIIFLVRMMDMRRFDRASLATAHDDTLRRWEDRYLFGGLCTTLICGTSCGYALVVSQDPFAELACISVTIASMISVVGRNYGSARAVALLSAGAARRSSSRF